MARKLVSFSCMAGSILMGTGVAWGEVNNDCVSSSDCNRICKIGSCVFVEGGGGHCEYAPLICDDGDPCTDDECNNGACQFVERICNFDNLFCTADFCDSLGTCREGLVSPCAPPTPECENFGQTNTGRCVECTDETHCVGNPTGEECDTVLGQCVECTENTQCTDPVPWCNPATARCVACLEDDHCDDDIACLQEGCSQNACLVMFDNCSNYLFCDGVETCDGVVGAGTCDPGVDQCTAPGQTCDEINDECIGCTAESPCEPDAHACTAHTCDLSQGVGFCVVTTNDSLCDDGLFCNGTEICDDQLGCVDGPDPCSDPTPLCIESSDSCGDCASNGECEDNIECTADTCVNDMCQNTDTCSDGDSCDGIETCDMVVGQAACQPGQLQNCFPFPYCWQSECVDCVYTEPSATCLSDIDNCTEDRCLPDNTCVYLADSDNDGVPNCCDNCPDTIGTADIQCNGTWLNPGDPGCVCDNPYPPACAGDPPVEGCSCYQLDSDGDGLNDCGKGGDSCPCDTGCPEKGDGCPCYPGEACCSTDPLSLCYCAP